MEVAAFVEDPGFPKPKAKEPSVTLSIAVDLAGDLKQTASS